jgi:hypothetical protein
MIVIRCVDLVGKARHPSRGMPTHQYLLSYDPEAYNGRGFAEWTNDIERAMRFRTAGEAWMLWRRPSRVRPVREDGQPNRPLTAFSIEVLREEDA